MCSVVQQSETDTKMNAKLRVELESWQDQANVFTDPWGLVTSSLLPVMGVNDLHCGTNFHHLKPQIHCKLFK